MRKATQMTAKRSANPRWRGRDDASRGSPLHEANSPVAPAAQRGAFESAAAAATGRSSAENCATMQTASFITLNTDTKE